jgi:hypothetical protein
VTTARQLLEVVHLIVKKIWHDLPTKFIEVEDCVVETKGAHHW